MTNMQVNYWNLVEQIRHNKATEKLGESTLQETKRTNVENEKIKSQQNTINEEHYARTDVISANNLAEVTRHNLRSEELTAAQQEEVGRSNRAKEGLTSRELDLTAQKNAETMRSNMANEAINSTSNAIKAKEADTNLYRALTDRALSQAQINKYFSDIELNEANVALTDVKRATELNTQYKLEKDAAKTEAETKLINKKIRTQELTNSMLPIFNFQQATQNNINMAGSMTGNVNGQINLLKNFSSLISLAE